MSNVNKTKLRKLAFDNICSVEWGQAFQNFFEQIMQRIYPGFVKVRPSGREGDWKCDGFVSDNETFYQVYAPVTPRNKIALKKLEEDFLGALGKWEFKKWVFVYGIRGYETELVQKARQLGKKYKIKLEVEDCTFIWQLLQKLPPLDQDRLLGLPTDNYDTIDQLMASIRNILKIMFKDRVSSRFISWNHVVQDQAKDPMPMRHGGPQLIDFVSDAVLWRGDVLDDVFEELASRNRSRRFGLTILSGPTGSGKTTSALHMGYRLIQMGWKVYYAESADLVGYDQDAVDIYGNVDDDTLLIIDNININPSTVRFMVNGFFHAGEKARKNGLLRLLLINRTSDSSLHDAELSSIFEQTESLAALDINMNVLASFVELIETVLGTRLELDLEEALSQSGAELPLLSELVDQKLNSGETNRNSLSEFALQRRLRGFRGGEMKTAQSTLLVLSVFTRMLCMVSYRFIHKLLTQFGQFHIGNVLDKIIEEGHLRKELVDEEVLLGITHPSIASLILESKVEQLAGLLKPDEGKLESLMDVEGYLVSLYLKHRPPDFSRFLLNATLYTIMSGRLELGSEIYAGLNLSELNDDDFAVSLSNLGSILHRTGHLESADMIFEKAIMLDEKDSMIWSNLGLLLQSKGDLKGAETALKTAVNLDSELAILWSNLGNVLSQLGKTKEARNSYEKSVQLERNSATIWVNYGAFLRDCENMQEAKLALQKGVELDPSYSDGWYNLGILLHDSDPKEALNAFKRAIENNPADVEALYNYGLLSQKGGRIKEAEAAYRRAAELDRAFSPAWTNLGAILVDRGKLDEGESAYREAIRADKENATAWYNLGKLLEEIGRTAEAEQADKRAIQIKPDYADAWSNLAVLYERQEKCQESLRAHKKALGYEKKNPTIWYNYGVLLRKMGEFEQALEANRAVIDLQQDHASARHNLAVAFCDLEQFDESREQFEIALKLDPNSPLLWKDYASCLGKAGMLKQAEESLRKAIELDNGYSEAWFGLGSLLKKLDRMKEAEKALVNAVELREDYPEAWLNLANLYMRIKNFELAEKSYRKAIEYRSEYPRAWSYLGVILMFQGKLDEAEKAMKNAIEYDEKLPEAWINLSALLKTKGRIQESTEAFLRGKALAASIR